MDMEYVKEAAMRQWADAILGVALALLSAGCSSPLPDEPLLVQPADSQMVARRVAQTPGDCPFTLPAEPAFVPPTPYPAAPPEPSEFWYGTEELWTALQRDGVWRQLPSTEGVLSQKTFWWRAGYDAQLDSRPALTVTGTRLDAIAPPLEATRATHGSHAEIGDFMLVGVEIPGGGCWEITGQIGEQVLSYVVWVEP